MTVEQLIQLLQSFDPTAQVILQRDSEGNGYSPLHGAEGNGAWDEKNREYGYADLTLELRKEGYSQEDCVEGVPAVVLWPRG